MHIVYSNEQINERRQTCWWQMYNFLIIRMKINIIDIDDYCRL